MKKTTCRAMGGACDAEITGNNAEEMMENGKKHVHETMDAGDADHKATVEKMMSLSEGDRKKWAEDFTNNFSSLEEA